MQRASRKERMLLPSKRILDILVFDAQRAAGSCIQSTWYPWGEGLSRRRWEVPGYLILNGDRSRSQQTVPTPAGPVFRLAGGSSSSV